MSGKELVALLVSEETIRIPVADARTLLTTFSVPEILNNFCHGEALLSVKDGHDFSLDLNDYQYSIPLGLVKIRNAIFACLDHSLVELRNETRVQGLSFILQAKAIIDGNTKIPILISNLATIHSVFYTILNMPRYKVFREHVALFTNVYSHLDKTSLHITSEYTLEFLKRVFTSPKVLDAVSKDQITFVPAGNVRVTTTEANQQGSIPFVIRQLRDDLVIILERIKQNPQTAVRYRIQAFIDSWLFGNQSNDDAVRLMGMIKAVFSILLENPCYKDLEGSVSLLIHLTSAYVDTQIIGGY
jgi:hypothetical protein